MARYNEAVLIHNNTNVCAVIHFGEEKNYP